MNDKKKFLDGVYGLDDPEATEALYRDWAGSYDDEVAENGYLTPTMKLKRAKIEDTYGPKSDGWYGAGQRVVWEA